jgi:hypothetical protein
MDSKYMRSELNGALTRVAFVLGCPSFLKTSFYVNKISILDYYRDSIWMCNRILYRHFCDFSYIYQTDNAHRKLQHALCKTLFCNLRVLGFISLEHSSLKVHILQNLALHYTTVWARNWNSYNRRWASCFTNDHIIVCTPHIVLINSNWNYKIVEIIKAYLLSTTILSNVLLPRFFYM